MDTRIPPWVAELSDSGRIREPLPDSDEAQGVQRMATLLQAFDSVRKPDQLGQAGATEQGFRWGHIEASSLIGQGSYGDVYRAFDTLLEREVALKLRHGDAAHARAFIAEARRLARVRHPHVLAVHGAGVHEGRAGLWADLLEGHTVADTVAAHGPLSWPALLALAAELAGALTAVHRADLVHGDIKPSNIMLGSDGHAVLMDFGAAEDQAAAARFGVLGSPLCMAPEQLEGANVTTAADLYSLGVVLHYAATGRYPLHAATMAGLQAAHDAFDASKALQQQAHLPRAFRDLVADLLARDPAGRPDATSCMRRIAHIESAPARRRKRLAVGAIIASLVLALVVSLVALKRVNAERHAAETARAQQAAISAFLEDTLGASNPVNAGADARIIDVLDVAADKARREFADQPAVLMPLLRTIGNSFAQIGQHKAAAPVLTDALALSRDLNGRNSATSLGIELRLAISEKTLQAEAASSHADKVKAILERARTQLGDDHRISVYAALELASWHDIQRQFDQAEHYARFALAQRPDDHGPQAIQRATALWHLAEIKRKQGQLDGTKDMLQHALRVAMTYHDGLNKTAYAIRNSLAIWNTRHGKPALAEAQYRAALATAEHFGESSLNVRATLLNLGGVLNVQHKYKEAEKVLRRTLALSARYGGEDHRIRLVARNGLATNLSETGRLVESGEILEKVLAGARKTMGAKHPFTLVTLVNLAEQRIRTDRADEGHKLAQQAAEQAGAAFGQDHVITLEAHELMARARFVQGDRHDALAAMQAVCVHKAEALGANHQYALTCLSHRADMLAEAGRHDQAVALLQQLVERTEAKLGRDTPGAVDAREHLATLRGAAQP